MFRKLLFSLGLIPKHKYELLLANYNKLHEDYQCLQLEHDSVITRLNVLTQ